MKRFLFRILLLFLLVAIGLVVASAVLGRATVLSAILGPVERQTISFASLTPPDRPNWYLVCPEGVCGTTPQADSPVFDEPVTSLRDRWRLMVAGQPRTERLSGDDDAMQEDYVQRSKIVGWPDTVTVRFIALDESRSTLAVYSRSHYGYSDMGVNQSRVEAWLATLGAPGSNSPAGN